LKMFFKLTTHICSFIIT